MESADVHIKVFSSFEDENEAEHRRLAAMTPEQRWQEMAVLQGRVWGVDWATKPIERIAHCEVLDW